MIKQKPINTNYKKKNQSFYLKSINNEKALKKTQFQDDILLIYAKN